MRFSVNLTRETKERFDLSKFIEWDPSFEAYDILASPFLERVRNLPPEGFYTISTEAGRMDLISYRIYGSTQYWAILMDYNSRVGHESLVAGSQIMYPRQEDMERVYFELKAS